jgi:hypothetical protein
MSRITRIPDWVAESLTRSGKIFKIFSTLGCRPMAGRQILVLAIEVRILASQPTYPAGLGSQKPPGR